MVNARSCSILTDANAQLRMFGVRLVEKSGQRLGGTAIPAVVTVPRNVLGDEVEIASLIAGRGGGACRVFLFRKAP